MNFALAVCSLLLTIVHGGRRPIGQFETLPTDYYKQLRSTPDIDDSELVVAYVMFRHGDRTPDQEELDLYPAQDNKRALFPYGPKALTNKGKQRAYNVGGYLRRRYDGFVNRLYLPEEVVVRTTDYDRTKMTALTAMAGMYPPPPPQRWNTMLDWQPVPYKTPPYEEDDLLYWYNCPRYLWLRDQIYKLPEVSEKIAKYQDLFAYLSQLTNVPITKTEDVFMLSNLFQALESINLPVPRWALDISDEVKNVTILEYSTEFSNKELIQLATGVLIADIQKTMNDFVTGREEDYRLRLYSAHENNVAALMAAAGVFDPHQPPYGSTFSLELRRVKSTGEFGVAAVYAWDPKDDGRILPMAGCGGKLLCNFDVFMNLTKTYTWTQDDYKKRCPVTN